MTNRIEYIDALRGFVMLLVVLCHVPLYCYHNIDEISFCLIPTTFHLALFFFISGWFCKIGSGISGGIWQKFVQLIVPTVVFYLLYCWLQGIDILNNLWNDKYKAGYWFCIVLFIFHLMITITKPITEKWGGTLLMFFLTLGMMMLSTNLVADLLAKHNLPNVLCIQQWQYFVFFYMGLLAKRYKERFFSWLDNGWIIAVSILLFFGSLFVYYRQPIGLLEIKMTFILWGGLGSVLSFAFFRKFKDSFNRHTYIGRALQYIGRRTLDIYLLHFFFLPKDMESLGVALMGNGNQTVELFVSLIIAMMVVGLCLLTSNIIRLSPQLAHWLFGVK